MRNHYLYLFIFITSFAFSQEQDAWVYFNAKPDSQTYFDTPSKMLSQRALDRRTNQNILLDSKDIPIEKTYVSQVKAVAGITVMAKSKWLNAIHVRGTQTVINSLKTSFSFVEKIDFADKTMNQTARIAKLAKIKKTDKTEKTKVDFAYGGSSNQIQMLNGQLLHQQNYTGTGKIIAVMDAGFPGVNTAQPFQRLIANNQILGGYDYVQRNSNFYTGNNHGTMVLSSMGGYKENALVGTAPDASYYLFITEDNANENPVEESLWVEAAEKADSLGVDIINTSLGYFGDHDNPAYDHTYSEMDGKTTFISRGANVAFSRGMIVVASAGNEGGTAEPHIGSPADALSVIAVGAVNASKVITSFSSVGPSYDNRIKPDVMAQGQAAVLSNETGNIITANGTSFSGPIMAGMIACLWQANPAKTNQEIKQLLLQSSDRFANPDNQYGYGIPNFGSALGNGLPLVDSKDNFSLYPNPTADLLSVSLPKGHDKMMVSIYTLLGQKVLDKEVTLQSANISLKALEKGMYIYKAESDSFSQSGKIIKQ